MLDKTGSFPSVSVKETTARNSSGTWTPEREAELKRLIAEGRLSSSQMAAQLGVSRNAVCGKADRLGLTIRDGKQGLRASRAPRGPRITQTYGRRNGADADRDRTARVYRRRRQVERIVELDPPASDLVEECGFESGEALAIACLRRPVYLAFTKEEAKEGTTQGATEEGVKKETKNKKTKIKGPSEDEIRILHEDMARTFPYTDRANLGWFDKDGRPVLPDDKLLKETMPPGQPEMIGYDENPPQGESDTCSYVERMRSAWCRCSAAVATPGKDPKYCDFHMQRKFKFSYQAARPAPQTEQPAFACSNAA
jgi:hypothetical protein